MVRVAPMLVLAAVACNDDARWEVPDEAADEPSAGLQWADYQTEIVWEPCALYTGGTDQDAACATVDLPLDWSDIDGDSIAWFVKRIGDADASRAVWLLQGGPGGAGNAWEYTAAALTDADPDLVAYLPDHRGVGRSTRLGCAAQEADDSPGGLIIEADEWEGCIGAVEAEWGDDLQHFTTTHAAVDIGWFVDQTGGDADVTVWGGSYGTFWLYRYLQIFPAQAQAAGGIGPTNVHFSFTTYDENFDATGRDYLALCDADPTCSGYLGPDSAAVFEAVYDALDAGGCPEAQAAGVTRDKLQVFFGTNLLFRYHERALAPAVVHRLQRCNDDDIAALQVLGPQIQDPLAGLLADPLFSRVLARNIQTSELWEPPLPTPEDLDDFAETALFNVGSSSGLAHVVDRWPSYPEDAYADQWPDTDIPVLLLAGELDPATPPVVSTAAEAHFSGPDQRFVLLPAAAHAYGLPMTNGGDCALNLMFEYLQTPTETLTDCRPQVEPVAFDGLDWIAQQYLGSDSLWE